MNKKLYVGNLSYDTTEDELRGLFATVGAVASVTLLTDRDTGRPKGFGFVEMETAEDAQKAIQTLNGQVLHDRAMKIDEARPPREQGSRGGYGYDRGGRSGPGGRGKSHGTPRRSRY